MKKAFVFLMIGLSSLASTATETCSFVDAKTGSANFFLFNNGLQAICQKAKNETTTDNKNLCADDIFVMGAMQTSSVSGNVTTYGSYKAGTAFIENSSPKGRSITLDKVYKVKVLTGVKEIVIQPGTYQLKCQGK